MSTMSSKAERAERQARIEEDIRRLFARYRRGAQTDAERTPRFTAAKRRPPQRPTAGGRFTAKRS